MTVLKKLLFVFNPHAGKGQIKENLCGIIDLFTAGGYEVVAYATQAPRDGYEKIVADGCDFDLIVVSGGDGTLSEAVSALMTLREKDPEVRIPLGYIPAGSTNDFANSIGIPQNMKLAAKAILSGEFHDIDIGQFNDRNFVYVAGFGAFTDVSYMTPQDLKNKLGHAAYIVEALKSLPKISGQTLTVEHDGETITDSFIVGLISNSRSIGGMKMLISKNVCFNDGLFEVVLIRTPKDPLELSSIIAEILSDNLSDRYFVKFKASKVRFSCDSEVSWTLDGESGGSHKQVTITNCCKAVRFAFRRKRPRVAAHRTATARIAQNARSVPERRAQAE